MYFLFIFILLTSKELKFEFTLKNRKKNLETYFSLDKYIFEVKSNSEDRQCIELCLDDINLKKKCYNLVIENGSFHIWINQNKINNTLIIPTSDLEQNIIYKNGNVKGKSSKEIFYINNYNLGNLNFLISDSLPKKYENYDGMIGLGYLTNTNEEYIFSFIQQLYNNQIIYHRIFTQSFLSSDKGEISFGEIPKKIISDYKNYGRCKAIEEIILNGKKMKNNKWQCNIIGVFYGRKFYPNSLETKINGTVSFFSYRKRSLIPKKAFEYFEKTYFLELIKYNFCRIEKIKRYESFICKKNMLFDIDFNFVFGDWIMHFPAEKMFIKYNENEIQFIFSHKENHEEWTLGKTIVKQFIMVYDLDNNEIGFYNENNVMINNNFIPQPPNVIQKNLNNNNDVNKHFEKEFLKRKILFFSFIFIVNIIVFAMFCKKKKKKRNNAIPLIKKNFSELNEMDL